MRDGRPQRQAPGDATAWSLPGMGLRQVVRVGVDQVDGEEPGPCRACRTLRDNILVNALQRRGPGPTANHALSPTPGRSSCRMVMGFTQRHSLYLS